MTEDEMRERVRPTGTAHGESPLPHTSIYWTDVDHFPTPREMLLALAVAKSLDSDTVAFTDRIHHLNPIPNRFTRENLAAWPSCVRACRECGWPVERGPNWCEDCSNIQNAGMVMQHYGTSPSGGARAANPLDLECKAQRAEYLSTRYAQVAIKLLSHMRRNG